MNRRTFVVLGAEALAVGCLSQPTQEKDSPTSTDQDTAPNTSWGDLTIVNGIRDPVTVTLTAEDIEGSAKPIHTFTDTVQLGPNGHEDHDHSHKSRNTKYTDIPMNVPGNMHRLVVSVKNGPRGTTKFRPANMNGNLMASIWEGGDNVKIFGVVGPAPTAPTTTTE